MKSIFLALVLLAPLAVAAQESSTFDRAYDACVDQNGPINNSVVYECAGTVSDQARASINQYYTLAHARLLADNPADADKLETAQKSWVAYRNTHCALATVYVGSPMSAYCPMKLNIARALELEELAGE